MDKVIYGIILDMKNAYEKYEDEKTFEYEEIIKKSDIPDFFKGYICRYIAEQEKIYINEKDLLDEIIYFIKDLNI